MKSGKVHFFICTDIAVIVTAGFPGPARMHCDAGLVGDVAIGCDPSTQIVGCDLRVRVIFGLGGNVDHTKRNNEVCNRDFIHRLAIGREMQRRVDVRSSVFVDGKVEQVEPVFLVIERLVDLDPRCAEIGREGFVIDMRHVHDAAMSGSHCAGG